MKQMLRRLLALLCALTLLAVPAAALSVEDALSILEENYIYPIPEAAYSAQTLDELFSQLEDPYTYYMSAEEYEAFLGSVEGTSSVSGIGASIQYTDEGILLVSVLPGGSAMDEGLQAGDLVIAIDGVSCVPANESHRALMIGEPGTYVTATVRHADGTVEDYRLQRRNVIIYNTNITVLDGGVGLIDCDSFGSETGSYFTEGIQEHEEDVELWMVDLRSNSGGTLSSAIEALGDFVGSGLLVALRNKDGQLSYRLYPESYLTEKPVIVLTNGYSASASELFTAGIRDRGAGIVVGERTFGKGVAQIVRDESSDEDLFDGDAVKVTAYRYYSVDGNTTDRMGVIPTLLVSGEDAKDVALLLASQEPDTPEGYLWLRLAGWDFYVDAANAPADTLRTLISALPPDAEIFLGSGQNWVPITTAMASTLYEAGDLSRWFDDVSESDFADEINALATYGLLQGDGSGSFHPEGTITRAELCDMLAQLLNVSTSTQGYFTDVTEGHWYTSSVNAMALMGFVDGVGGGLFDPDGLVTQQEFCAVMSRVAAYLNCNAASYIEDLTDEEVATDTTLSSYSAWAQRYGYIMDHMMVDGNGNPVSILQLNEEAPQEPILREEAAATLYQMLTMFRILSY